MVSACTYRSLDVPPEPVVEHVGEVEALFLRLDRLLAHEPQAAGDDLERRRRREDLPLHAVGERRHLRLDTFCKRLHTGRPISS